VNLPPEFNETDEIVAHTTRDLLVAFVKADRQAATAHYEVLVTSETTAFAGALLIALFFIEAIHQGGGGELSFTGDPAEAKAVFGFAQAADEGIEDARAFWQGLGAEAAMLMLWNLADVAAVTAQRLAERDRPASG
jgi:hypothetical protein